MSFDQKIKVNSTSYASTYNIKTKLPKLLNAHKVLSLDTETRSVYGPDVRAEASDYLKESNTTDPLYRQARAVAASDGLSFPSITRTTHFIFGESRDTSTIVICDSDEKEMAVWKMIADYEGLFLIHNSLFDLKIMYQRLGCLPKNYIDTSLIVKCLINHVNIWKSKTSLKELMGPYYDPQWTLMDNYEPDNLKEPSFIEYAAIDGAATYHLWELVQEELSDENR